MGAAALDRRAAVAVTHDDHPLRALYEREYRSLVRLASLLLDDPGTCEEVVQDAFVRALVRWRTIGTPDNAAAYLRSAVLNGARSKLRRRVVARRHPDPVPGTSTGSDGPAVAHAAVVAELRRLPRRQRECVVLRLYLDLPETEVAAALGISTGSVKTHLHRGLATLTERLGDDR